MTFTVATTYLCVSQPFGEPKHIQYLIVSSIFYFSFHSFYFHGPYLFALEHIFLETQERNILTKDGAKFLSFYCMGPKHQLQQRLHVDEKRGTWLALLCLSLWSLHFNSMFSRDTTLWLICFERYIMTQKLVCKQHTSLFLVNVSLVLFSLFNEKINGV